MRTKIFKPYLLSLVFSIISILFVPKVYPASETIYASYKYTMGDNDTKNDAKRICFIEAKRLAIEKAGTFIESSTEIRNFQMTRDEIRTYAGAIIKVDIVSEEVKFIGESTVIFMTVKADVDVDSFRERVRQIKTDRELENKVREQQSQLKMMEDKIMNLQRQLTTKDFDESIKARKERREAFEIIDELEKIKYEIKTKTKAAIENIELGMTPEEVVRLIGRPRAETGGGRCYNYGAVWVVFENGVVTCLVKSEYFLSTAGRSYYKYIPQALIK